MSAFRVNTIANAAAQEAASVAAAEYAAAAFALVYETNETAFFGLTAAAAYSYRCVVLEIHGAGSAHREFLSLSKRESEWGPLGFLSPACNGSCCRRCQLHRGL